MPLMAPALTCVSPAGWLGIKWLSSRGCKDVAGLCPGNEKSPLVSSTYQQGFA